MKMVPNERNRIVSGAALADSRRRRNGPAADYKEVLVVVDVQNDFFPGGALQVPDADSLIEPLNREIERAHEAGMRIVFTQDWHPPTHLSFDINGGEWPLHCIQNTAGASLHRDVYQPEGSLVVRFGTDVRPGYSPFENEEMDEHIYRRNVQTVYVTGIALEYCVAATCLDIRKRGKQVVALDPLIRAAEPTEIDDTWRDLLMRGIVRAQTFEPTPLRPRPNGRFPARPRLSS